MLSLSSLLPLPIVLSTSSAALNRGSCVGVLKLPAICDGVSKVLVGVLKALPKPDVLPKYCCINPGDSIDLAASKIGVDPPGNPRVDKVSDPHTTGSRCVYDSDGEPTVVVVIPPPPDAVAMMLDEDAVLLVYGTVTLP